MRQFGSILLALALGAAFLGIAMSAQAEEESAAVAERSADVSMVQDSAHNLYRLFKYINAELGMLKKSFAVANRDMSANAGRRVSRAQRRLRNLFRSADRQLNQLQEIADRNVAEEGEELYTSDK